MEKQEEQQAEISEEVGSRNELVLDNWKLVLIFFVGLIICTIFFAAGLIVGKHQPRVVDSIPATTLESLKSYEPASPSALAEKRASSSNATPPKQTVMDMNPSSPVSADMPVDPSFGSVNAPSTTLINIAENTPPAAPGTTIPEPPARTDPAPVSSPVATSSGSVFRVQLAAMKTMAEAQAVVDKLKKKGFEAFVVQPKSSSDAYYRVQMGDFSDRAAAQEVILKLQQAGERPVLKRQQQ
jgi:cell division septation protein DedD